jgi:membrane associated rhomboid family serine protease
MVTRRQFAIGAALGAAWGVIATLTHLAMFRGDLPAPTESSFGVAVLLYLARAPFLAAIFLSTAIGRNSSTLVELLIEALVFGVIVGVTVAALLTRPRRSAK